MLSTLHHLATRRKRLLPPLVDADGKPLATRIPPIFNWCRISLVVSLVPAPEGNLITYSLTRRTLRATVHATRGAVATAVLALAGCVPWIRELAIFAVKNWLNP